MPKVGLDPGHGGKDPGAVGPSGLKEKDVNLAVALELEKLLKQAGVEVVMTRREDRTVELKERSDFLNRQGVDLAVSLHCNAWKTPEPDYLAVFVYRHGSEAERAAEKVLAALVEATGWPEGGVRAENFQILRETKAPAILIEQGFITNPAQEKQLGRPEFQKALAGAIAKGLFAHLGIRSQAPPEALPNIKPWARQAVAKAIAKGLVFNPELLSESEQKVLVWFDRLGLLPDPGG
ncbi:MAG: N-acetylmuramoyl-L-alanine amidase [Thermanaerothrix sp.]|nr:N-acetylmuramoyl-L-alanine amidase [Thermanaerothrix sp.]